MTTENVNKGVISNKDLVSEVAQGVVAFRKAKAALMESKGKLVELACKVGISQEEALKIQVDVFLDGYLVANGNIQSFRK